MRSNERKVQSFEMVTVDKQSCNPTSEMKMLHEKKEKKISENVNAKKKSYRKQISSKTKNNEK